MNIKGFISTILRFIPGFRSGVLWKSVIASIYYIIALLCAFIGIGFCVFLLTLPFIIVNIITAIRSKNKNCLITAGVAFVVMFISPFIGASQDEKVQKLETPEPTQVLISTATPAPESMSEPTPEPTINEEIEQKLREQEEAERLAAEQAEAERIAAEQAETERIAAEQAKRETTERAEAESISAEKAESERIVKEEDEKSKAREVKQAESNEQSEEIVWIGSSGEKYHRESCRTLSGSKRQITLQEAKSRGREACKICKP